MQRLSAAFPAAKVDADTIRLYLAVLSPWSFDVASDAVDAAIRDCRFLPTVAELHKHYGEERELRRRKHDAEVRRTERLRDDSTDWAQARAYGLEQAVGILHTLGDDDPELHLERVQDGKCDDCPHVGVRFKFVKLALCSGCVTNRHRVKAKVDEEAA